MKNIKNGASNINLPFKVRIDFIEMIYRSCLSFREDTDRINQIRNQIYQEQPIILEIEITLRTQLKSFSKDQFQEVENLLILVWCIYRDINHKAQPQISREMYHRLLKEDKEALERSRRLDKKSAEQKIKKFIDTNPASAFYSFLLQRIFFDYSSILREVDKNEKHILLLSLQVLANCFEEITYTLKVNSPRPNLIQRLFYSFKN